MKGISFLIIYFFYSISPLQWTKVRFNLVVLLLVFDGKIARLSPWWEKYITSGQLKKIFHSLQGGVYEYL